MARQILKHFTIWAIIVPVGTIYTMLVMIGARTIVIDLLNSGFVSQNLADFLMRSPVMIAVLLNFFYPVLMIKLIRDEKPTDGSGSDPGNEHPGH